MDQLKDAGATGKSFAVLEYVTADRRPATMSEIIRATGISKPSAHRIVNVLVDMGFLERDPGGNGFVGGARLVDLAQQTVLAAAARGIRHALLEELARHVGETCNYGILSGAQVTYLDRVESKWPLGLRFDAGSQVPAHCTAIGKLLLSQLSENELLAVTNTVSLGRYTSRTLTNPMHLRKALAEIRQTMVGVDNQEFMDGVVCVAVPVVLADGTVLGGIAISAPEARMTLETALTYVPKMREIAERYAKTYDTDT
ncbi:MAG: IclR family transcriptional regulator [Hyphomicrobiales bacterium]|nr:IclR family transcriptional regulator [Hyphomicrobiales bacterium]